MLVDDYVCDVLMRDLVGHDRQPTSFLVYLYLSYEIGRSKRERVQVSYQNLADAIGISKSAAQQAVRWLVKRKLLESRKDAPTAIPMYRVLRPWRN
jgi:DNA-binding MarR family transcriptional regulator